jgi:hypothetical protein
MLTWFYISDNKKSDCEYSKDLALCLEEKGKRVRELPIQIITSGVLSSNIVDTK